VSDPAEQRNRDRLRSFLVGGVLGASAVAAVRRRRRRSAVERRRALPSGLRAFESAPCFDEETHDRKR
jgi:uncharacterized membrane protein YidH (DUF202 family)